MRGLFGRIASGIEHKETDISALTWQALFGAPSSKTGVSVNIDSALRVTTVLACARVLAEGVAQLPLKIFRLGSKGSRTPAADHPAYKLLYRSPNEWMTSFEMREMMMFHAVLAGNAYAYIGRGGGKIMELIPMIPGRVRPVQHNDYALTYDVTELDGRVTTLAQESVFHLRGPSWNGYLGMDAVRLAREAIGLAIATEETHARLHGNGAQPGGIISTDKELADVTYKRLKEQFSEEHAGLAQKFRTLVLDSGLKWQAMQMSGVDAQHMDTRRFQIEEICRAMRVFPQMVMHSDKTSTFASAESFFLAHVNHSLMPWIMRWENTIEHSLLADEDDLIAKFNVSALLRGDDNSRSQFYLRALGGARAETAYMTRNEVRALEELDPIEGGDTLPMPTPVGGAPAPEPIGGPDVIEPDPAVTASIAFDELETKIDHLTQSVESIRQSSPPVVNVTVPITLPKKAGEKTVVTEYDADGRIKTFERHEIEDK